jgi:hypothetical protein
LKKKYSLHIDIEHDYTLIGIYSVLEDYRLAYFLNEKFQLQLKKEDFNLDFSSRSGEFSVFGFENQDDVSYWSLIANKQITETETSNTNFNLFESISNTYILIPEKKKVDYFVKIEGEYLPNQIQRIIQEINTIHRVITSFDIDPMTLKSKEYLIY